MIYLVTSTLLFMCHLHIGVTTSSVLCPELCKCETRNGLLKSDCSSSSLITVPGDVDNRTFVLNISHNSISFLEDNIFIGLGVLQTVYLNSNYLRSINPNALKGLTELRELFLQNNMLTFLSSVNFIYSPNLKVLHVDLNLLKSLPNLTTTTNLEEFSLSHNDITSFDISTGPHHFPKLVKLNLSWNRISRIFVNNSKVNCCPNLKELDLSNNIIQEIQTDTFYQFPNLTVLNLSSNAITLANSEQYFKNNFKLKIVDLSINIISHIHPDTFKYNTDIEDVTLYKNNITFLHEDTFKNNRRLRILVMRFNKLNYLHPYTLLFNPNLQEVYFGYNGISPLHKDMFIGNPLLVKIDFGGYRLDSESDDTLGIEDLHNETFIDNPDVVEIDLRENRIRELHPQTFKDNPSLEILNLASNKLRILHKDTFKNNVMLCKLNLRNNLIKILHPDIFITNLALNRVNLRANVLTTFHPNTFQRNIKLDVLDLSFNNLVFNHDSIVNSVPLRTLNINHCHINKLPPNAFKNVPNLQQLFLNNNDLKELDNYVFNSVQNSKYGDSPVLHSTSPLEKLQLLDVSSNQLVNIDVKMLCNKRHINRLYIHGNPLLCDCSLQNVRKWCYERNLHPKVTCNNTNEDWNVIQNINCDNFQYPCHNFMLENTDSSTRLPKINLAPLKRNNLLPLIVSYTLLSAVIFLIVIGWLCPFFCVGKTPSNESQEIDESEHVEHNDISLLLYHQEYEMECEK